MNGERPRDHDRIRERVRPANGSRGASAQPGPGASAATTNGNPGRGMEPAHPAPAELDGAAVALLTRHGKEKILAPVLEPATGCRIVHVDSVDTDTLGTFTREIPRPGTQRDAARKKAELGAALAGSRFAIASEGAFVNDPWTGMLAWNIEMVLLLDGERGTEIVGLCDGPATSFQRDLCDWASLQQFAEQAGFPSHRLALRPEHAGHPAVVKGIATVDGLRSAFDEAMAASTSGRVFVENDLRAHCNPTRQSMIADAARNLLERLRSDCPACGAAGFWITALRRGRPCLWCGRPTDEVVAETWSCLRCPHAESRPRDAGAFADPGHCAHCNP